MILVFSTCFSASRKLLYWRMLVMSKVVGGSPEVADNFGSPLRTYTPQPPNPGSPDQTLRGDMSESPTEPPRRRDLFVYYTTTIINSTPIGSLGAISARTCPKHIFTPPSPPLPHLLSWVRSPLASWSTTLPSKEQSGQHSAHSKDPRTKPSCPTQPAAPRTQPTAAQPACQERTQY